MGGPVVVVVTGKLNELGADADPEVFDDCKVETALWTGPKPRLPGAPLLLLLLPEEAEEVVCDTDELPMEPGGLERECEDEEGERGVGEVGLCGGGDVAPAPPGKLSRGASSAPDFLSTLPRLAVTTTGAAGSGAGTAGASDAAFLPCAICVISFIAMARTFSSLPRKMGTVSWVIRSKFNNLVSNHWRM